MKYFLIFIIPISFSSFGQVWSPDGSQIAFFYLHEIEDIYLVNPDGTGFQIVDDHDARDFVPQWSPDGKKIVFTSVRDQKHVIYELSIADEKLKRITSAEYDSEDPDYSPDGTSIVYTSDQSGNNEIYIMDLASRRVKQITESPEHESTARWSPDGNQILFRRSLNPRGVSNLYTLSLPSGEVKQITNSEDGAFHQSWSPDGKTITYVSVVGGQFQLQIHDMPSGINKVLVSQDNYQVFYPGWSPDGKKIAFTKDHSEGLDPEYPALMVVDLQGNVKNDYESEQFP